MPKALPSNNMPWPENLIFDFSLPAETSPAEAESFISSIETSDRNRAFLRLRYLEGKQYKEIGEAFGITPGAVRMAVKYMREKYVAANSSALSDATADPPVVVEEVAIKEELPVSTTEPLVVAQDEPDPVPTGDEEPKAPSRPELDPIITALGTTTRQRTFVYDLKTRAVLPFDQVPRGLRRDQRYVPLPDYYQIREYDLMKEYTATTSPEKRCALEAALGGVGPFKAFRSTVRSIGLGQSWADYRFAKFSTLAAKWWDANVPYPATPQPEPETQPTAGEKVLPDDEQPGIIVVDPATLNGIALIETIRILFRKVGPADFEEALDELRDALCSTPIKADAQGEE